MDLPENKVRELIQEDQRPKWIAHSNHSIKCFTKGEIERITNKYRTILGRGAFGEVYKGVLEDNSMVAVKRLTHNVIEDFAKELTVHREINHKNVVRLIGYCIDENALMMVTEYMPNGNLSDVLHHHGNIPIPLDTRLGIAVECAEALCYMHLQMYTQVIHGDIKPANILLDDCFHAKLSDFGISRLVNTDKTLYTEHVIGTIGYMDPSFARYGLLTSKSDVYSFGVVLLELITRKKATIGDGEISNLESFTQSLAAGIRRVREMFDAEIASQKNNMKVLEGVAKLAGECLRMEMGRRPKMADVAERLRVLRKAQHQGKQMLAIFSWGWKYELAAPSETVVLTEEMNQVLTEEMNQVLEHKPNVAQSNVETLPPNLCQLFSLAEMEAATSNFDESLLVADGEFSRVYRGEINGGATKVAIKRWLAFRKQGEYYHDQFLTETNILSCLRHHHVASLIGYCNENNEMILVYDYIARGTLREHLYNTQKPPLTWKQRLEICIGAARGLHYIHTGAQHAIIHRDVKTRNILLDEDWVAKVSGFGLNIEEPLRYRTRYEKTCVMGPYFMGPYLDPDYFRTQRLTQKSDVYSFGVVLLEVLCARPACNSRLPREERVLSEWALICQKKGVLDQIIDPYIKGKIAPRCLKRFVKTAVMCVAEYGKDRPSMGKVLSHLELALQLQESADQKSGSLGGGVSRR